MKYFPIINNRKDLLSFNRAVIRFSWLLLWAKSNQKPFRAAKPAGHESLTTFCVSCCSCPLLLWSPRLVRSGLAKRPAHFYFSGQVMMEIAKLIHAAF